MRAKMPMIGFGTFQVSTEQDIYATIDAALSAGYRFIDSAQDPKYNNEHHIGKVLKELLPKHNLKRLVKIRVSISRKSRLSKILISKLGIFRVFKISKQS